MDPEEEYQARNHSTGKHADGVGGAEQVGWMRRERAVGKRKR